MKIEYAKDFYEEPLQKIFKVSELKPFESILIANLDFNNRVQNQLRENNLTKLSQLLTYSVEDIYKLHSVGKVSVENILSTLNIFFDVRKAQNRIESLNNFTAADYLRKKIVPAIQNLPDNLQDKNFARLVEAYNVALVEDRIELLKTLPTDLSLAEFPQFFIDSKIDFDRSALQDFIDWLHFDLKNFADKMIQASVKNDRQLQVLKLRAEDKTLQSIGDEYGLTRERVRQLEEKIIRTFKLQFRFKAEQLFLILHTLTNKNVLTAAEVESFVGENCRMIYFLMSKANLGIQTFFYEPETQAIAFLPPDKTQVEYTELTKRLPEIMHKVDLEKEISRLAEEHDFTPDLLRLRVTQIYQRDGDFYFRYRLPLVYQCGYVLREKFPQGYRIAKNQDYEKMLKNIQEIFQTTEYHSKRNVDAKVATVGMICGRGKYIHPDYIHVPEGIIDLVNDFVEKSERDVLTFKEIFIKLKDHFVGTQITDHYILQGVMRHSNCPYAFFKDYITKDPELNFSKEFTRFVERKGIATTAEVKAEFISINDAVITLLISRCRDVVAIGDGRYMHSSLLNLRRADYAELEKVVRKLCENYPVTSRYIFDYCSKFAYFREFFDRNEIYRHEKLFGVIRHMFRYDFYYCRPFIALENITGITNKKVLLLHIGNVTHITIADVVKICEAQEIHYLSKTSLAESLRPEFIRVNESDLYRPEVIGLTEEHISEVVRQIRNALNKTDGWLSAKEFKDFEKLPHLQVEWTNFLLESVVGLTGDAVGRMKITSTSFDMPSTVFVSDKYKATEVETFLTEILLDRQKQQPFKNEKEVFKWLSSQGLCNTKLPGFLEEEHFERDAEGNFFVK